MKGRRGFTLIELLVVIGIIATLIAITLSVTRSMWDRARLINCHSNLRQIHDALVMYGNDNRDKWPDAFTDGSYLFRMAPGQRTPGLATSKYESLGLAATLHGISFYDDLSTGLPRAKYLDGRSKVWVCPGASDYLKSYGNTYAFSIAPVLAKQTSKDRASSPDGIMVFDNYTSEPGLSGFYGPFPGSAYTIPVAKRQYPHHQMKSGKGSVAELQVGGYVDERIVQ